MKFSKVSVIIPVYNAEKYLYRCLNSAICQTLKDIEIIIVNDASTDNSLQIIQEFQAVDKRIKLINFPKNKGNGIGRNTALKKARGQFILFLDADDWLEEFAIETLYLKAISEGVKIVLMGYRQHFVASSKNITMLPSYETNDPNIYRYFLTHRKGFGSMPWCYFYSRSLLMDNDITFTEGVYFEDVNFVAQAIFNVKVIGVVSGFPLYNYLVHKESITGFLTKKKIEDLFVVHILLKEYLIKKGVFEKFEKEYLIRFLVYCIEFSFLGFFKMKNKDMDAELKMFMNDIRTSEVMSLDNISVLKGAAEDCKSEKLTSKHLLSAYNFLGAIRTFYKPYRFVYKTKYRIFNFFKN